MIIVNIQEMKKYHAANLVLDGVTLQVYEKGKVGLVGRNGSGKSTLFRLIAGHEKADEGSIAISKGLKIGYLPQVPAEFDEMSVYDVLAFSYRETKEMKAEMAALEGSMSEQAVLDNPSFLEKLLSAYAALQERFERSGGYEMDAQIDQVAGGLGIDRSHDGRLFGSLSGGEKTRIVLASQLVAKPDLLLLDEPTNHLDLKGMEWLEQFLSRYEGTAIIVSHDRYFLDAVTKTTIELEDGEAITYHAPYSGYVKEKEERLLQQFADYQEQQKTIKKMKESIAQLEGWGRIGGNEKFFKRAASIRRALEKMEKLRRPVLERKTAEFSLSQSDRSAKRVLSFSDVHKEYDGRTILNGAEGSLLYGEKVALLGHNGSGKTTLFKLLLGMEMPGAGEIALGERVDIGYLAQQEPAANLTQTVLDYFRTEDGLEEGEARNVLAAYLFYGNDVFKPLSMLSGGEWSRLRLALLVRRKPNLLLLDEPTNHLDIASREALEEALEQYPGTLLAISHDRYFINRMAQRVWELEDGRVASYLGNYDEYKTKRDEMKQRKQQSAENQKLAASQNGFLNGEVKPSEKASMKAANKGPVTTEKRADQTAKKIAEMEKELAKMEQNLACIDEELARLSVSGEGEKLESEWRRREELEQELNSLMERWLEASSEK
ncbi:ribosomal protection-like ABC-F family protein [Paenibacillus sp. GCM10027627]|uniref:ribosomal protection-like ABC-F family protein n=1 Tax=unclassified Paenibacillus TaxID=185978 RepID=UPI0036346201